jgi:hypothetical protein
VFLIGCECDTCHTEAVFRDRSGGGFPADGVYYHLTPQLLEGRLACQRERPDGPTATSRRDDGSEDQAATCGGYRQCSLFDSEGCPCL